MNTLRNLLSLALVVLITATGATAQTSKKKKSGGKAKPKTQVQAKKKKVPAATGGEEMTIAEVQPVQPQVQPQPEPPVQMQQQASGTQLGAEQGNGGLNPNSSRPIDDADVMYKVTNWRRMDLREKLNQPFFSKNNEITKYLIDGYRSGLLKAYTNDSLTTEISGENFSKSLMYENTGGGLSEEEKAAGFGTDAGAGADDGWGGGAKKDPKTAKKAAGKPAAGSEDDGWGGTKPAAGNANATAKNDGFGDGEQSLVNTGGGQLEYFPKELVVLEIKEDFIFDRKRSRAYNDIQALTIIIPAEKTARGFDVPVASFRYKDVDKYFRSNPTKFIWYNSINQAQHKNMADAFDLRLFNARLIKQSNANDAFLSEIYQGEKAGLVKSQQLEYKLMEFEHNLWEY